MFDIAEYVLVDGNVDGPQSLNEHRVYNNCTQAPTQALSQNGLEGQQDAPGPHPLSFNAPDNATYMRCSISSFIWLTGLLTCPQVYCFALLVSRHYSSFMATILSHAAPANTTQVSTLCPTNASLFSPPLHLLRELRNEVLQKHSMALYFASSTLW